MDFLDRHPKLVKMAKHIHDEEGSNRALSRFIALGPAVAMAYLFAASATERENKQLTGYSQLEHPSESEIDFSLWDKAQDFWQGLAQGAAEFKPLHKAFEPINLEGGTRAHRLAVLTKAWNLHADGKKITAAAVEPDYAEREEGDEGARQLASVPSCGGIDLGDAS
jgi:hypothetical protein